MKSINIMKIYLFIFSMLFLTSCSSIQKDWKTDGSAIEKDIALSKKHGLMLFTASDTDPQSKNLLENVFTGSLFSKINKDFIFYNVDIVKDEESADSVQLEKNYVLFSDYNITQVPYLCLINEHGDVYHSDLIPEQITSSSSFLEYLNKLKEKGKAVENLRKNINEANGPEKIKAINAFFDKIYLVDSEKYRNLFEEGIKSDPSNESGLLGSFILARMQLNIEPLFKQQKHNEIIAELNKTLETGLLTSEEEQGVLCNIAYFYSILPNTPAKKIIEYLEAALKKAPNSFRAATIREDIEYLKNKN
ncbi:hypothetical protein [Treponema putidum]|uniref:Thioredoxin-like protein n=1 Tax=Treponema putidum TaxID=221027 RepID=A0AAE9SIU7_9SPIR|nr:hypothetical protein [Treponema putidum]AIN93306.1 hypothetical protein JO40_03530 [Treponema putidum]TWI76681.1 hypothetical protein JM98_01774 [Treponema putidum]UTY32032.1 hypothetical protein E4N75_11515 [Treponema putidum]UTY34410.1 hypothetical protein E4N74_10665 [Treponema putidum]